MELLDKDFMCQLRKGCLKSLTSYLETACVLKG